MAAGRVGFLGLGIMGRAMAGRLAAEGAEVLAWNRSPAVAQEFAREHGAKVTAVADAAEVAASCDVTFAMLAGPAAALSVAAAAVAGLRPGSSYVDCSTVDEGTGLEVEALVKPRGAHFLSAPVSGGWRECKKGAALFLCGGSSEAYEAAASAMGIMGEKSWLCGETPAHAARAKLCLQVSMGTLVASLAESLALAEGAGVDKRMVHEMLQKSALRSPMTAAKGLLMIDKNYAPNFQVYLQQKDLRLAMELGNELDVQLPITAAANAMYVRAKHLGHANSDFAAVAEAYSDGGVPSKEG